MLIFLICVFWIINFFGGLGVLGALVLVAMGKFAAAVQLVAAGIIVLLVSNACIGVLKFIANGLERDREEAERKKKKQEEEVLNGK